MAFRNIPSEELTPFGRRLWHLIETSAKDDCDSARKLARHLYDKGLVTVNSRNSDDNTPEGIRERAIHSIERKILNHFQLEDPSELQGEFIVAYCRFFHCSADYLLGFTDIMSEDIEVRRICEKTGLSEKAVQNLIGCDKIISPCPGWWSSILSSNLFDSVPNTCADLVMNNILASQEKCENDAARWCRDNLILDYDCITGIEFDEGYLTESEQNRRFQSEGLLYKISREFTNFIEYKCLRSDPYDEDFYREHYNRRLQFISTAGHYDHYEENIAAANGNKFVLDGLNHFRQ